MRIRDWSSDMCSSDLADRRREEQHGQHAAHGDQLHEGCHAQAQAGQCDCTHDKPRRAAGDGNAYHVASALLQTIHGFRYAHAYLRHYLLLVEPGNLRPLRNHLDQHGHHANELQHARRKTTERAPRRERWMKDVEYTVDDMRISCWMSDVCSSDLAGPGRAV